MSSELAFTKQFLVSLNSRPLKFTADFAEDMKKYAPRMPFTLPKPPAPPTKRPRVSPPPTAQVTFKPLRPPTPLLTTPPLPINTTTTLTLKLLLSQHTDVPIEKLKLLVKGKVLSDVSFLNEFVTEGEAETVVTVMFMGGATPKVAGAGGVAAAAAAAEGDKMEVDSGAGAEATEEEKRKLEGEGEGVAHRKLRTLEKEEFWVELEGWLAAKLGEGDPAAKEVVRVWMGAMEPLVGKCGSTGD
ncbi:hypothetical protein BDZ91DRAFT_782193 [Kalaharituber pfeilii]|nr:hypothetical protein BDZ91DRAFT_782193 [Kalaharituber pfeilii]